jgi:hypothetical protein
MQTAVAVFRDFVPTKQVSSCIVCCTPALDHPWRQLAHEQSGKHRRWYFFSNQPRRRWEQAMDYFGLSAIRASWQAIQTVKHQQADLLITGESHLSLWCAIFAALRSVKVHHVVCSLHFSQLPRGISAWLMQLVFPTLYQFIVHSKAEKRLYGNYFGISQTRFEMIHWDTTLPTVSATQSSIAKPLISGEYICAVSHQGQGLQILMTAMEKLHHVHLVVIGQPETLRWLKKPANVTIWPTTSEADTWNILQHSRFIVSSTKNAQTCCDYRTLVTAMHLGKTFVVTDSLGVNDYAFDNSNAVICEPSNPNALRVAIRRLWQDPEQCERLGNNGQEFAATFCSGQSIQKYVQNLLVRKGF